MHSPFVFDFILHVLNNRNGYTPPAEMEDLRKRLLKDFTTIEVEDLGAGSRKGAPKKRSVKQIAATAVKPRKWSHFLYRLVRHYSPNNIIELGTSLGLSTAYMAAAHPGATVYTIEGSTAIQQLAAQHFALLGRQNIQSFQGHFDAILPSVLAKTSSVDLSYIDGNHRYAPTLSYFNQLLPKINNNSIFIFDDIHWSAEMEQAWREIKKHPSVTVSVDLFFMGLVFFRQEVKVPQHYAIRF